MAVKGPLEEKFDSLVKALDGENMPKEVRAGLRSVYMGGAMEVLSALENPIFLIAMKLELNKYLIDIKKEMESPESVELTPTSVKMEG